MGQLHDLIRAAKRATIIEVARKRHKEHMLKSSFKPWEWWSKAAIQAAHAEMDACQARIALKRYLRKQGLPTDSPLVPQRP